MFAIYHKLFSAPDRLSLILSPLLAHHPSWMRIITYRSWTTRHLVTERYRSSQICGYAYDTQSVYAGFIFANEGAPTYTVQSLLKMKDQSFNGFQHGVVVHE
nr:hypothetical protein [Tanacetum cinerariifolium]